MNSILPLYLLYLCMQRTVTACTSLHSYGDLRRLPNGLVQLYRGTDGSNLPTMWGTLDGSLPVDKSSSTTLQKTICQQLGFKDGIMTTKDLSQTQPYNQSHVWLSNITCPNDVQHILRCGHAHGSSAPHRADIFVNCKDNIRDASASNAYLGQLTLIPPAPCINDTFLPGTINSVSFGIVAMKQAAHNWMYFLSASTSLASVSEGHMVNRSELDTICRSAGFTHADPNSAMTVHDAENMLGYQFDQTVLNSKRDLSDIDCADSYQCLSQCCFHGNDEFHVESALDYMVDRALVVRCTFYASGDPVVPGGTQTKCKFDEQSTKKSVCNLQINTGGDEDRNIFLGVGGVLALAFTVSVGINVAVCIAYVRLRRRGGYGRLNGADNGGPPPNGGR